MIDREVLRRDMQLHREEIARRAEELADDHAAIMASARETLRRAEEAAPVRYSQPVYRPAATKAEEPTVAGIPETWIDATAIALAHTRDELRDEFHAAVAPLRENIARLEGQITTLTSMLEGRRKSAPRDAEPARPRDDPPQLRLAK